VNHSLSPFSGEQIVQVTNPDPFAKSVLRSPVLHTPLWMIATAQLFRPAVAAAPLPGAASGREPDHRAPGRDVAAGRLARPHWPRGSPDSCDSDVAAGLARLLVPARRGSGAMPVPPLAVPALLGQGHDCLPARCVLPGPLAAAPARLGSRDGIRRSAGRAASARPVTWHIRRRGGQSRARFRGHRLPHPQGPARRGPGRAGPP
jgi:hypothetical protein